MFGIGFLEIIMISLALLIFLKPKDLPRFFFKIGKGYRQLRDINRNLMHELNKAGIEIKSPNPEKNGEIKMKVNIPSGEIPKEIEKKEEKEER